MPEFILDHGTPEAAATFKGLDSFTQGYIEAMFFTETGTGDDGDMRDASVAELASETLATIQAHCAAFQKEHAGDLGGYYWEYDSAAAGRDFWYTRNHHGVGFWDRELSKDGIGYTQQTADNLTKAAHAWREIDLYRGDDGKLYLS